MGIGVTCQFGPAFVVLHKKGAGSFGDATVPGYAVDDLPQNALGDTMMDAAAAWIGSATAYPAGIIFTIDDTSSRA